MSADQKIYPSEKWKNWAEDISQLKTPVTRLFEHQLIWNEYGKRLAKGPITGPAAIFHNWLKNNYIWSSVVVIRRLVDGTKHTISFVKVLENMAQNSTELTWDNFYSLWGDKDPYLRHLAYRCFHKISEDNPHVTKKIIQRDMESLEEATKNIKDFVDEKIAHHAKRVTQELPPTFGDMNKAVDSVIEIHRKYNLLVTGGEEYLTKKLIMPLGWEKPLNQLFSETRPIQK